MLKARATSFVVVFLSFINIFYKTNIEKEFFFSVQGNEEN